MKKFSLYLLFSIALIGLTISCGDDDIYNTDPDDTEVRYFYTSEDEFEWSVNGLYDGFFQLGYYGGSGSATDIIIVGDLLSDNLITNPGGRGSNRISHIWGYDSSAPSDIYSASYQIVSRANALLGNLDNIDAFTELEDPDLKQHVRGHALAMRALAHFEIARNYVKIPTQSADANSFVGIPYVDVYDPYIQPARLATVQDVYARIVEDLTLALNDIPDTYVQWRMNKNSVRGLLSRVYLYMGEYDLAIAAAAPVVAAVQPCEANNLQQLWRSQISDGVLIERPVSTKDDPTIGVNYSQGIGSGLVAEYVVDKAFYDTFEATDAKRRDASIQFINSLNVYAVKKYLQSTYGAGIQHGRYLRVEEVILNMAEAQYLDGDQGGALTTLNKLRDKRYTSYAGGETGDALFAAIQNERRKELCFETGDRWFTLKRLQGVPGIPSSFQQGVVRSGNGHFADGTGVPSTAQTLSPSSAKWQFPMTNTQLIRNPNLTQTPGY